MTALSTTMDNRLNIPYIRGRSELSNFNLINTPCQLFVASCNIVCYILLLINCTIFDKWLINADVFSGINRQRCKWFYGNDGNDDLWCWVTFIPITVYKVWRAGMDNYYLNFVTKCQFTKNKRTTSTTRCISPFMKRQQSTPVHVPVNNSNLFSRLTSSFTQDDGNTINK